MSTLSRLRDAVLDRQTDCIMSGLSSYGLLVLITSKSLASLRADVESLFAMHIDKDGNRTFMSHEVLVCDEVDDFRVVIK